jgi:hypothetical protein
MTYLDQHFKYKMNFGFLLFNYIFYDKCMLTNKITKMKYNGRMFIGIYNGRSSLNKIYNKNDLRPYNQLYLDSFKISSKYNLNLHLSKFKLYLRKPLSI